MKKISDKVIGRLTRYRALLTDHFPREKKTIFSHELGSLMRLTPSQVRRDLMCLGCYGLPRHGYEIDELVKHIGIILDAGGEQHVALVGVGNLGRALITFFEGRRSTLRITAAFDADPVKAERLFNGVPCHPIERLDEVVAAEGIRVAIVCVPGAVAQETADRLVRAQVKGILNFAPVPLRVPAGVFLEELDVTSSLEKVAYFTTRRARGEREGRL